MNFKRGQNPHEALRIGKHNSMSKSQQIQCALNGLKFNESVTSKYFNAQAIIRDVLDKELTFSTRINSITYKANSVSGQVSYFETPFDQIPKYLLFNIKLC